MPNISGHTMVNAICHTSIFMARKISVSHCLSPAWTSVSEGVTFISSLLSFVVREVSIKVVGGCQDCCIYPQMFLRSKSTCCGYASDSLEGANLPWIPSLTRVCVAQTTTMISAIHVAACITSISM